ncbi:MAG: A24 family peptidase [Planctomycetota bacterium]
MLSFQEIGLLLAGVMAGALLNHLIYALAYFSKPISPWQTRPSSLPALSRWARVPIIGWLHRKGDDQQFGKWFWVRPLLLELATPFLCLALYRTIQSGTLVPTGGVIRSNELTVQFISFAILLFLMALATWIDFDEQTIPDSITVPGTWIGLIGATLFPGWSLLETHHPGVAPFVTVVDSIHANSPYPWPLQWGQVGVGWSIGLPMVIWWIWCCSLGNLRWITRRGWSKAWGYGITAFLRSPNLPLILGMLVVGSILIVTGYAVLSPDRWRALFSSLMGIGLGGCLLWSFRIVATQVLQQQALGFGDVTLMAMVGAFFGWQIVWIAFFLAPLFGIVLLAIHMVVSRDAPIAFGPYLCAATTYLMFDWNRVWPIVSDWFPPAESALLYLGGLLVLLGALLWAVRWLKLRLGLLLNMVRTG